MGTRPGSFAAVMTQLMRSRVFENVIKQRRVRGITRFVIASLVSCSPLAAQGQAVQTVEGAVSGTVLEGGVQAWLGIPFAAPPVGDLRWKPPQPANRWTATFAADRFAPSCMQPLRDHGIAYYVGDDPVAEDCLYLNVWAPPGASRTSGLPVIVYVYGGSFVAGSSRKPLYVGDRLAAKGAIVVGFNYRLGTLGFLAHPELTAESPARASGNYGLLDQVAALKWVNTNIAAFGGDPRRVTIMGQSAGSMSIALLQTSPLARGLFSRIVGLSGSVYLSTDSDRLPTRAEAESRGWAMQKALGAPDLASLRRLPPDRIVALQGPSASPTIDGLFLTERPSATFASRRQADVPLLIGTVADETLSPVSVARTLAEYRSALVTQYGANAGAVEALYPATDDASARAAALRLGHDAGFSTMARSWA
ncbi:MAG TPA: carboxylesterase family protein, partial [Sphingomicrobium sp.]